VAVRGGYLRDFETFEDALAAAQVDIIAIQEEIASLSGASIRLGTFITYEDVSSSLNPFSTKMAFTYEKPSHIMSIGRRHNGSEFFNPRIKESSVAWVVGIGAKVNRWQVDRIAVPNKAQFNARPLRSFNMPGYLIQDRSTIRRFDNSGQCTTIMGTSASGC